MVMGFLARAPRSTRGASASTLALLPARVLPTRVAMVPSRPSAGNTASVAAPRAGGVAELAGRPDARNGEGAHADSGPPPVSSGWRKPKRIASGPAASAPVAPARRANPTAGVASIPDSDPDSDPDDDALGPADERSLRRCRDALLASNERVARLRAERDAARADAEHLRSKMDDVTASWTRAIDAETVARADAREANRALDTTKHRVEELQRQLDTRIRREKGSGTIHGDAQSATRANRDGSGGRARRGGGVRATRRPRRVRGVRGARGSRRRRRRR